MTKIEAFPCRSMKLAIVLILLCDILGYIQHEYGDIALANAVYRTFHSDRFEFIVDN